MEKIKPRYVGAFVHLMRKKQISIFLVIFALLITVLANIGYLPLSIYRLYDFPYGDKIGHFLLMGLLSFSLSSTALASRASLANFRPASIVLKVSLLLTFFVTLEEFSQKFFHRRTFSLLDLAFGYAGIAFFGWLVWFLQRKRKNKDI